MRIFLPVSAALLLAACGTTPPIQQPPIPRPPEPAVKTTNLVGVSIQDLGSRFGAPSFQVREGTGVKLQWSNGACVLDVFLYPPQGSAGPERVTYVEARRPSGDRADQAACITALDAAG